ncbi:MAG TPA: helix-turn-helix transcriptional regulator [Rhizomicrobium sp.]
MNDRTQTQDRDEVLFAFHRAYERPTAEEIIEWVEKYPQFAEDIRRHATVSHDMAARRDGPAEEPDESTLARAYSRALSALYEGEIRKRGKVAPLPTLREILAARGKTVPSIQAEIAGTVGISRGVVADLFNGMMLPPLSRRFETSICAALGMPANDLHAALERTVASPRLGHANAASIPALTARSCEDIFRNSGMTPEQIAYWLNGD